MISWEDARLLGGLLIAVFTLIVLITRYRMAPFIALLLVSMLLAVITGLPLEQAGEAFASGVGGLLASTALVIGFGAIIGSLLADSGGAEVIANRLATLLGIRQLGWTLFLVGTVVGIGVWFTVGLVLLAPVSIMLARRYQNGAVVPICAVLAGLSAMHGLAPPHPGPLAAIALIDANVGRTILWSLVVGIPAGAIAGPLFWLLFGKRFSGLTWELPDLTPATHSDAPPATSIPPSLPVAVGVLVLPVLLMVLGSATTTALAQTSTPSLQTLRSGFAFFGDPTIAMLVGTLSAYYLLGTRRHTTAGGGSASGGSAGHLAALTESSLHPVANVLLIVGCGAGFSRVLIASGVGQTLADVTAQLALPPLLLGWLLAATVRVATGSATTGITTAAGLMAPLVAANPAVHRELMVLSMGAGSLTLSHVNDGGFWFVKEYFGMSVEQTLKTWTVLETVLSLVALVLILLLQTILS